MESMSYGDNRRNGLYPNYSEALISMTCEVAGLSAGLTSIALTSITPDCCWEEEENSSEIASERDARTLSTGSSVVCGWSENNRTWEAFPKAIAAVVRTIKEARGFSMVAAK